MTRRNQRERLITGRPRTSTLVLIGLFIGVLALYILVRPVQSTPAGNVQQNVNPTPTYAPASGRASQPTQSPAPAHSSSPSSSATPTPTQTPTQTAQPSHTPTPGASATSPSGSPAP